MNKKTSDIIRLSRAAFALTALAPFPVYAIDATCADVEVLDEKCLPESVKVDLSKCADTFTSVKKIVCEGDSIVLDVKGKDFDHRISLARSPGAWGAQKWAVKSQSESDRPPVRRKKSVSAPVAPPVSPIVDTSPAHPAPASPVSEPAPPAKEASAFKFGGYFDAYYQYGFNRARINGGAANPQVGLRSYDGNTNQVVLNLAEITGKYSREETSFIVDLDFGSFADANAQTPTLIASGGPTSGTANEMTKHIGQAVFTYAPKHSAWTLDVGKMPTHVGLEMMKPRDNWNYSRSALFTFGGPFWHTGAHLGYALVPERLTVGFYLYNGWNTVNDANNVPTYGSQVKWTPNDRFTWIYNYIGGPEQANNIDNWKQVHETNAVYSISPNISFASDFLYGSEAGVTTGNGVEKATWYGAQLGFKFKTSEQSYLSPRVEYYRDRQGYTLGGSDQTLMNYTLTHGRTISEGFEVRFEGQLNHSDRDDRFTTGTGTSRTQPTLTIGILYSM